LFRLLIIAALGIALLIPTLFVSLLTVDRQNTRSEAVKEVTQKWGSGQTIVGPVLTLPLRESKKTKNGEVHTHVRYLHILPKTLDARVRLTPEIRYRGIYRVVLYTAELAIDAVVAPREAGRALLSSGEILWKDAFLTIGVSDLKGIQSIDTATWNQQRLTPEPGVHIDRFGIAGLTVRPSLAPEPNRCDFVLRMTIRGSEEFRMVPAGKETRLAAVSLWGDPSFVGDFLPDTRSIQKDGFQASWRILDVNRDLPQAWVGDFPNPAPPSFGVKLFLPVDEYQKTQRALKYAIMFIALSFLAFFTIDVMAKFPFHPVHYLLAGLALVLFYVLLLSLSEYLPFSLSYLIAGTAIVLLNSLYTYGITHARAISFVIAASMTLLYGFLFVLLQLQDYALLIGSTGLFVILAVVMYLTRWVNWFGLGRATHPPGAA